jgi:hypothetical protein
LQDVDGEMAKRAPESLARCRMLMLKLMQEDIHHLDKIKRVDRKIELDEQKAGVGDEQHDVVIGAPAWARDTLEGKGEWQTNEELSETLDLQNDPEDP